ncbi:MAG TPA: type II CAAX endopeptidase family protein [Bacteroidia bacterium]|nr:type II CAAX endopeptidase family protein [Bacteroidia bacterium]
MNGLKRPWTNLILAPLWFLIIIVVLSIYLGGKGVSETDIPVKIAENTPTIILVVQVFLFATLLLTTRKDGYAIFKTGWTTDRVKLPLDIFGGISTGAIIAVLYIYILSPLQFYLQLNIGDYVPAGETMTLLGKQVVPFFIANVIFAPLVEESVYRNYSLTRFLEKYSQPHSIILTSAMFGLLHWVGGLWYILLTGLFVGFPFALIAAKRKNIIGVFVAHLTLNLIEFIYITKNS